MGPGYSLNIQLVTAPEDNLSPKMLKEKQAEDQQHALRKAVEAHPLVQSAQSVFKTEIKSIKGAPRGDA